MTSTDETTTTTTTPNPSTTTDDIDMNEPFITRMMNQLFHYVDISVEMYLITIIQPFLLWHEVFYNTLNQTLRYYLDLHQQHIPIWFTANFITYGRTMLLIPTLYCLSQSYMIVAAILVVLVDFYDFLDGVVARYWVDVHNNKNNNNIQSTQSTTTTTTPSIRPATSPTPNSDADSFEVISTGSPYKLLSWVQLHRNRTYGGFIDAVLDKVYVVPCWICLLGSITSRTNYLHFVQYFVLFTLMIAEMTSGYIRFKAYYTSSGVPAPTVVFPMEKISPSTTTTNSNKKKKHDTLFNFNTSAVKADHIGKAKQTFEMIGTALYLLIPVSSTTSSALSIITTYFGLLLLLAAIPLAYESIRRKITQRVIYVHYNTTTTTGSTTPATAIFDHKMMKFWMQAAAMGSKLIVGIPSSGTTSSTSSSSTTTTDATTTTSTTTTTTTGDDKIVTDLVLNACSVSCVDEVIAEVPIKIDLMFLEKQKIDFIVVSSSSITTTTVMITSFVTDEVIEANRVLIIGDDNIARPATTKSSMKKE